MIDVSGHLRDTRKAIGFQENEQPLFQEIILELQLKKPVFQDIILHDFYKILALINRTCQLRFQPQINQISIDRLVTRLHYDYQKHWDIHHRDCSISRV